MTKQKKELPVAQSGEFQILKSEDEDPLARFEWTAEDLELGLKLAKEEDAADPGN